MASTPLLGLSLPADGTTNWGTLVNTSITALLDSAVAGTTTLSSDADVTLSATTEAANQARQAIILWTATGTATRTITAPAQSKTYVVINATGGTQSIVFRGTGPTTGVTIPAGAVYLLAWNGSDFVTLSNTSIFATDITVNGITVGRGAGNNGSSTTVGNNALDSVTTGVANTAVGYESLRFTAAGSYNTALGHSAGRNLLGDYNTAIGYGALQASVAATGVANIAIGPNALSNNTGGNNNIAIGNAALYANSYFQNNIAIGEAALSSALSENNIGIGKDSIQNANGQQNIGIGNSALTLISGQGNVGIGYLSIYGGAALGSNTANDNTAVGYNSLSGITTGDLNTVIGKNSGKFINTGSKNTIIGSFDGNQGGLDIRSSSNYIVLSDGDGNPRAYWNGANATFNGNLNTTGTITQNSVAVVTTTGTQTLSNKTLDGSCTYNGTATNVTGIVSVANGGTGLNSIPGGYVLYGNSASTASATGEFTFGNPGAPNNTRQLSISAPVSGTTAGSAGLTLSAANTTGGGTAYISMVPRAAGNNSTINTSFNNLILQRGGSDYITLDANGTVLASGKNIGLGGTSPSTSGTGITFPAIQATSADVNTLDDYEEGSFTPVLYGLTTAGTGTYNSSGQIGYYVKIGKVVKVQIRLSWSAHTGTGDMAIDGLPFPSPSIVGANDPVALTCSNITLTANNVLTAEKTNFGTTIQLRQYPVGGGTETGVPMDTSGLLTISCVYIASA